MSIQNIEILVDGIEISYIHDWYFEASLNDKVKKVFIQFDDDDLYIYGRRADPSAINNMMFKTFPNLEVKSVCKERMP